jgi:hypothetical protein
VLRSGGGLTYEAGNASAVETQGVQIFDADRIQLGERAERFATAEHGWPTVLHQLFAVYQRVVDRRES